MQNGAFSKKDGFSNGIMHAVQSELSLQGKEKVTGPHFCFVLY